MTLCFEDHGLMPSGQSSRGGTFWLEPRIVTRPLEESPKGPHIPQQVGKESPWTRISGKRERSEH